MKSLIESRQDPTWESVIIETLPLCLRDTALRWYKVLGSHRRAELNTGWTVWESSLCNAFQPDASEIQCLAGERKWEWPKESIASYFYTKLSLLRAAFPTRQETDLLNEISYGLPASLQLDVRTHLLASPKMDDLLTELRNLEGPWKATLRSGSPYNSRNDPLPQQLTPPSTYSTPSHLLASAVDTPQSETVNTSNKFGLATNYEPANISYIDRDSRRVRTYKLPNSRQTISLGRPCRSCSQDHFDFEHDFLSRQPKGEAHIAYDELELTHAYGYSTICPEPTCASEDKYIYGRATSFETSSSQSNVPPNSSINHQSTPIWRTLTYQGGRGPQCPETRPKRKQPAKRKRSIP